MEAVAYKKKGLEGFPHWKKDANQTNNNDKTKKRRVSLEFRVSFSFFLFYKTV